MIYSQRQQIGTSDTYWEILISNNDSTLKISGNGDMPDFIHNNSAPWYKIGYTFNFLEIGDSITKIGNHAFSGCSGLTTLTIPNSVTFIGNRAFNECSGLTGTLILPKDLTFLGIFAFNNCSGLTTLNLPNSLTIIEGYTFSRCSGLTSVSFPNGLDSIGGNAFWRCSGLTSIILPASLTAIGRSAFSECSDLTSIVLPAGLTYIDTTAFWKCSNLAEIINLNPVPISIDTTVFQGVDKSACILKVLTASLSAYQQAPIWQEFLVEAGVFLITALSNDSLQGTVNNISKQFYLAGDTVSLQATPNTGYIFENWTSNGVIISTDNPFSFTIMQDTTIMANFTPEVSMHDIENQANKIIIYPNPVKDRIYIQSLLPIEQISIYNISGKKVKQINHIQKAVSVDDLATEMYFIKVKTENGETVRKIIKQ
jgi:hypothetical protein